MQRTDYNAIRETSNRLLEDIDALVRLRATRDSFLPMAEEKLSIMEANMLWRVLVGRSKAMGTPLAAPEEQVVIIPEGPQFADENWDDEYEEDDDEGDEGIPLSDVVDRNGKRTPDA